MPRNWALVVGINRYDRLRSLRYAERDAELVRDYLHTEAGFEQVFHFSDNSPDLMAPNGSLQSTRPTYANLWSFLWDFFESPPLRTGDNFWFFFSGHGIRFEDRDYLMPSDGNPRAVDRTGIPLNYVTERLRRCGADNVVLMLDACRYEGDKAGLGVGLEQQQGVVTFFSCSPKEKSWELEPLQQGSFTYTLLEALRIQGEGNCATVERLYQYLRHRVAEVNSQHGYEPQTPYAIVEPATKYHLILLPRQATLNDLDTLKLDAYRAESEKDYALAEQLWIRVNIAAGGSDRDALEAIKRITLKIALEGLSFSSPPEPVLTSGNKSPTTEPEKLLRQFGFDVVTVNERGKEIKREHRQAEYFAEDLGNGVELEMMAIPGGEFIMGAPEGEKGSMDRERPQHQVAVQPFFMSKYPVTQVQWRVIASLPKVNHDIDANPSYFKGDNCPVETVPWDDAVEFCERLSAKTGENYRIPSEAEWEYACRAETTTPYHCGGTITPELANYGDNRKRTSPVGDYSANAFGIYDMHGNVWEWCLDHWHSSYKEKPEELEQDGSQPWLFANKNAYRTLRGGSWYNGSAFCRSAFRDYYVPGYRISSIGVRVMCNSARTF